MFYSGRKERRAPSPVVVSRELQIVAVTRHAPFYRADPAPRVEPGAKRCEHRRLRVHARDLEGGQQQPAQTIIHSELLRTSATIVEGNVGNQWSGPGRRLTKKTLSRQYVRKFSLSDVEAALIICDSLG